MGPKGGTRGPRIPVSQPERPGVERSPVCVGPDAQCERSENEHRSRSKWASKRNERVFRLRDKAGIGGGMSAAVLRRPSLARRRNVAGAKAAALRTRGNFLL